MKTALASIIVTTLLGIASIISGRPLDVADFTILLFTVGLVIWTVAQYNWRPRELTPYHRIRLAASSARPQSEAMNSRLAA